jgi:outer membrane lipoprotein SlyB
MVIWKAQESSMERFFVPATLAFVMLASLSLVSCASRPQLYPNTKYKQVGKDAADKDVDDCMKEADDFVESGKGKAIARGAGSGAAVGGAVGAVAGAFSHNILGGALLGGAVGATAGGAHAALSPDQIKRNYVNQCLHDRGYKVLGWD